MSSELRKAVAERDELSRLYLEMVDVNLSVLAGRFCEAMRAKLGRKHADGRTGWAIEDDETWTPDTIRQHIVEHAEKGDPIDVANFALFLWYHEARIAREAEEERGFDRKGCEAAIERIAPDAEHTEEEDECAACGNVWKASLGLSACPKCYPIGSTR